MLRFLVIEISGHGICGGGGKLIDLIKEIVCMILKILKNQEITYNDFVLEIKTDNSLN